MSSNMKIAIGAAALAIVAIIATIFIVNGGFTPSGLYVTSVSGNVYIDNIETGRTAAVMLLHDGTPFLERSVDIFRLIIGWYYNI